MRAMTSIEFASRRIVDHTIRNTDCRSLLPGVECLILEFSAGAAISFLSGLFWKSNVAVVDNDCPFMRHNVFASVRL